MRRLSTIWRSYFPSNGSGNLVGCCKPTSMPGFASIATWSGWLMNGFNSSSLQSTKLFSIVSDILKWIVRGREWINGLSGYVYKVYLQVPLLQLYGEAVFRFRIFRKIWIVPKLVIAHRNLSSKWSTVGGSAPRYK